MNDDQPHSGSRNAARQRDLELLRSRGRSKTDRSKLDSWFEPDNLGFRESGYRLIQLMDGLKGSNRFFETWRQDRSQKENREASGIDPLVDQDGYIDFQGSLGSKADDWFSFRAFAYSGIFSSEPHVHVYNSVTREDHSAHQT